MKITVPPHAARDGALRIWLRRIPVRSQIVYAFRSGKSQDDNHPVSQAVLYGRGEGSSASERVMLLFRPNKNEPPFQAGEVLTLKVHHTDKDEFQEIDFDVSHIE